MPQRKTPQSLRTISKCKIIQNLSSYSTDKLQNLPTNLSEELIDLYNEYLLCENECQDAMECYLRYTCRNRLIKPNMKKLDLSIPNHCKLFFQDALMIVFDACKNVTHFSCNFYNQSQLNLYQLVTSMPNLIELKLSIGKPVEKYKYLPFTHDHILEEIGNACCDLEILHLTGSRITTHGVRRFCQSKSAGAKIKELNLNGSHVTVKGCLTALRNLKQLKRFYCNDVVLKAFIKLFEDLNESPIPSFQLCTLGQICQIDLIPTGFFSFVTKCCPNVRSVNLNGENNFDRHVQDLESCNNENACLDLDICLLSIDNLGLANLGIVGCRVTDLTLWYCQVHLPTIGFGCPNLTDLSLFEVNYTPFECEARNNSGVAFSKLQLLNLKTLWNLAIPIDKLQYILHDCLELETLSIARHDEFTDEVMSKILHGVNPLRRLVQFELLVCSEVSSTAILQLLQADNELEWLTINYCAKIQEQERVQIETVIQENNFGVTLEVINYISDDDDDDESGDESHDEFDYELDDESDDDKI